jgi:homopolymeric O-antigen transport system ATP-binding protein
MRAIQVDGLGKRYVIGTKQRRDLWALRDVSFAVDQGEILGVIGPNGAGKTTLLKVLSRVTPPTEGRVVGRGRVVPLLALGAGFQPDLSGRENIFMNAALYGMAANDVEKCLDEIIEFAGIGDFIDVPVKRYSSGMYLRLAFSVAVNMNPDILLADEVLAVGDIEFQERCLERVKQAGDSGMSVLFVSHDMDAITRLCDRVLWLSGGHIIKIGTPEEVVAEYQNSAWSLSGRPLKGDRSGSHKNDKGEIVSVMLTSVDGREIGAVRTSDEVLVNIGVMVKDENLTIRFVLHVHARGALAFRVRSDVYDLPQPGKYIATVRIPSHLLAETIYSVTVEAILHTAALEKYPLSAFNVLAFHVFDTESSRRDVRGGVVAPNLEWTLSSQSTFERVEQVSAHGH